MNARLVSVRGFPSLIPVLLVVTASYGQATLTPDESEALVKTALAAESRAARDTSHPMRYRLRKSTPRLTTTKEIFETRDGAVARLISINDQPLSQLDEQKEQARLNLLLSDPSRQRHRKQSEDEDAARANKLLRALPDAFLYRFEASTAAPTGTVDKFSFWPNPKFDPPDLETQVLTAMTGEIWIDPAQQRVTRLEGHLQRGVDIGWGMVARLYKGGWIVIEQADVGDHQWRIVHLKMQMSGRVLFWTKSFDTTQDQSQFAPVPADLGYQQALHILRSGPPEAAKDSR
jgi:hypothetical protein